MASASLLKKAALDLPEPNSERTAQSLDGLAHIVDAPVAGASSRYRDRGHNHGDLAQATS